MRALDAVAVRAWAGACVRSLSALRADIDGINVYPVADSDTGSNLLYTLTAAQAELTERPEVSGAGEALGLLARGAVAAARGNSGVIISQVLRGLAESAGETAELDGPGLASALKRADALATDAVARPVAGTMLSVLHAVATAVDDGSPAEVATTAAKAAADALEETPNQLAALAVAGVVDAGGRGLVAVLDALVGVVSGTSEPERALSMPAAPTPAPRAWEVMYLLADVDDAALPALRRTLSGLGDSVTVAGDGAGNHAVHVHCADIGAAIEAGLTHGRPHRVRVEPLMTPPPVETSSVRGDRAVVAVVRGEGLAALVADEGVPVLAVPVDGEPSAEELLGLVTETAASHVTVLPGGVDLTAAAERIAGHVMLEDRDVVVVPCASPVQVLAALAVHDADRRAGADVVGMAEAAAATRRGDLVVASEESITWVGRAQAGDLVGLVDGEVVLIGREGVEAAAIAVLERMLVVGGELVTVLTGAGAPDGLEDAIAAHLRAAHPEVELVCYSGGQTDALLLMGVE
ncbi:DAK2 domain-containing protein [Prauserella cavernicola]|uniref:DAK2 domain-containing protein n=1 Tax=Prauserella cavernicola TaxID=2800127 RepID=A0A934QUR1_9PSEU|nr:DAK2 domain-containing protein [Prauserella cavernicola]MBK1786845.1 DAK2 domain-containing protein [Prauserella cavernicola]